MIASGTIAQVLIGQPELVGGSRTAFCKRPATGAVSVHVLGLVGDAQANRRVHGGLEKAVYAYPVSGYAGWQADLPELAARFAPGSMGENLCIVGQDEGSICIGDVIRAGTATLQVAQIREPCNTLARVLGTPKVVRIMSQSGRSGWYLRVLDEGLLAAGDDHQIIERPNPGWTMLRFSGFARGEKLDADTLAELAVLPGLTAAWQRRAARAFASARA